jgi:signal transduction histidine kinase
MRFPSRIFAFAIMLYMVLGIGWWAMLLYSKNSDYFAAEAKWMQEIGVSGDMMQAHFEERRKQSLMILGEGLFLGISLIAGVWIIHRSSKRQLAAVNQQNNFILSVSHELKSPLAAIRLALETMKKRNLDDRKRGQLSNQAIRDTDRLEQLIQNILMSASMDNDAFELHREEVQIDYMLRRLAQKYSESKKVISVEVQNENGLASAIRGDGRALELAFKNLIENALKYSPDQTEVSITIQESAENMTIQIIDQGYGLSSTDKSMLFKRFYRSARDEIRKLPGTGLGLYICAEIIKGHGGKIRVDDNPAGGTIFEVTLPVI